MSDGRPVVHCWTERDCAFRLAGIDCEGNCQSEDCYYAQAGRAYFGEQRDGGICMLLLDHEGPHEWTPTEDIRIEFKGAP